MYTPESFREDRPEILQALMKSCPLAALVTSGERGIEASHIPLLFTQGKLEGHFSRANDHWRATDGSDVLAIFQGAQAYISPNWYLTKQDHGRAVPTWNYCVVHARGKLRLFDDPQRLRAMLQQLTAAHEAAQPRPWSLADAPASYIDGLLRAIVGFEIDIASLEGKWKVSQNQPLSNREGAARGLEDMARLIRLNP